MSEPKKSKSDSGSGQVSTGNVSPGERHSVQPFSGGGDGGGGGGGGKAASRPSATSRLFSSKPKTDWRELKDKFLKMDVYEKRNHYHRRVYTEYNEENFPGAIKPLEERDIKDKICVWQGDITTLEFDAIVNAANERMRGGGGVDGAIHSAAGDGLLQESISQYPKGCDTGDAKITGGYELPAKYVIHTVGPRNQSAMMLQRCYQSVLKLAEEHNLKTVAFPCISTGIFGYPNKKAADVALQTVISWLLDHPHFEGRIVFCVFLSQDQKIYDDLMENRFEEYQALVQEVRQKHQAQESAAPPKLQQEVPEQDEEKKEQVHIERREHDVVMEDVSGVSSNVGTDVPDVSSHVDQEEKQSINYPAPDFEEENVNLQPDDYNNLTPSQNDVEAAVVDHKRSANLSKTDAGNSAAGGCLSLCRRLIWGCCIIAAAFLCCTTPCNKHAEEERTTLINKNEASSTSNIGSCSAASDIKQVYTSTMENEEDKGQIKRVSTSGQNSKVENSGEM